MAIANVAAAPVRVDYSTSGALCPLALEIGSWPGWQKAGTLGPLAERVVRPLPLLNDSRWTGRGPYRSATPCPPGIGSGAGGRRGISPAFLPGGGWEPFMKD